MPPKEESAEEKTKSAVTKGAAPCNIKSPGPKYKLRTLVGQKDHCISKQRGPAFKIGEKQMITALYFGPGPKYLPTFKQQPGFSFGLKIDTRYDTIAPGPKYHPGLPRGVAFTIKSRTNPRKVDQPPGPKYQWKNLSCGEGFTMGIKLPLNTFKYFGGAGPYKAHNPNVTKTRAPIYSHALPLEQKIGTEGPGPKYHPKIIRYDDPPIYSFGTRHGECAPPFVLECDDLC